MAPTPSRNPAIAAPALIMKLLPKFKDADPDIRFMSLNDVTNILIASHCAFLKHDLHLTGCMVFSLVQALQDQNGDVQSNAIKCTGALVKRIEPSSLASLINNVCAIDQETDSKVVVVSLAVRAIISAVPPVEPGSHEKTIDGDHISVLRLKLLPHLTGWKFSETNQAMRTTSSFGKSFLHLERQTGRDHGAVDILIDFVRAFGTRCLPHELNVMQQELREHLLSDKISAVTRKKAIAAIGVLSKCSDDEDLSEWTDFAISIMQQDPVFARRKRAVINACASIAHAISQRYGVHCARITPHVLAFLYHEHNQHDNLSDEDSKYINSETELEGREVALNSLDAFFAHCPEHIQSSRHDLLAAGLKFISHDPNYVTSDDEMDEDGPDDFAPDDDDDFEPENAYDEEDDSSWKLRRAAAKLLHTMISSQITSQDIDFVDKVATALVSRLRDREDSVCLEIYAAMTTLVHNFVVAFDLANATDKVKSIDTAPESRKRRRESDETHSNEMSIAAGTSQGFNSPIIPAGSDPARECTSRITPQIMAATPNIIRKGSGPLKKAALQLLAEIIFVQHGAVLPGIDALIMALLDSIASSSGNDAFLRIAALRALCCLADHQSARTLEPYLPRIVSRVCASLQLRQSNIAIATVVTIEAYIKVLTPPRSAAMGPESPNLLATLYQTLGDCVLAAEADTEIRAAAVKAIGLLVARTSGADSHRLLKPEIRRIAQSLITERMQNELTRVAAINAFTMIAVAATNDADIPSEWLEVTVAELTAQLRKASRSLKAASLRALTACVRNVACRNKLPLGSAQALLTALLPLFEHDDNMTLVPALHIACTVIANVPESASEVDLTSAICKVVKLNPLGHASDMLISTIESIGSHADSKSLMNALLKDVGVAGSPALVGRAIGTLLVASSSDLGVTIDDFRSELKTSQDDTRKCLALYTLGEAARRLGPRCDLSPDAFTWVFDNASDKVAHAAATSLGLACVGDIPKYLPQILAEMDGSKRNLFLHTAKELLQHHSVESTLQPYAKQLWDKILAVAQAEDNKIVGAECIGRLAIIDPAAYVPQLQSYLSDPEPAIRGMIISALQVTIADSGSSFDVHLEPVLIDMLTTMLSDANAENRRLGLGTFDCAVRNKPRLVLPELSKVTSLLIAEATITPELVRIVTMGPFKQEIDEGLETRKAAYGALYVLLQSSIAQLPLHMVYERVLAGLLDDHAVKLLCCLILTKLLALAPETIPPRLDTLAAVFKNGVLATKIKDGTVKHEVEKHNERVKAVLKISYLIHNKLRKDGQMDTAEDWRLYWDVESTLHAPVIKTIKEEVESRDYSF